MTAVIIAPRVEDMDSDTEAVLTGAFFRLRPSTPYVASGQWVTAEWPAMKALQGSPVTVQLDAHASVPYEIEVFYGTDLRSPIIHEYRMVPSSGSAVKWEDLTKVTGPTGEAAPTDTQAAINAALWAAIGSVSGGATNLAGITDMSAFARTLNDDTSASAARTTLDAAATSHAHGVGDLTASGTPSSTTFLRGDGTWSTTPAAGNPDWADITGKPSSFPPSDHSHAVASTDLTDATAVGEALMTAADADAARTVIGALGGSDPIGAANVAVAGVLFAQGSATPRPTARTDVMVLWKASSMPVNMIPGDVWLNGPDS